MSPSPINTAAKERMVIGFDRVNKIVETYAPTVPPFLIESVVSDGLEKIVFNPR